MSDNTNGPRSPAERWEAGTPHDPRSVVLFSSLAELDFRLNNDYFCWRFGGDGDNGEILMYLLDEHFRQEDQKTVASR